MPILRLLAALSFAAILAACEAPGTYPVSGVECDPDDPVHELSANPCPDVSP